MYVVLLVLWPVLVAVGRRYLLELVQPLLLLWEFRLLLLVFAIALLAAVCRDGVYPLLVLPPVLVALPLPVWHPPKVQEP